MINSILVHVDASPRATARLAIAERLAARHGAELRVLYGVLPSVLASPWASGEGMAAAASVLASLDREQRERAHAALAEVSVRRGLHWIDGGDAPYWSLLQRAPYADLMVLGQHDPRDTQTGALPPDLVPGVLLDSGRPSLVVPFAGAFEALPARVLVAWKPTREAARAVSAARPWLRLASTVHVAVQPPSGAPDVDPADALTHWLQVQGVTAEVRRHILGPGDFGERLLALAGDSGAELLVMGCYGHSRAREWALGGATRTLLQRMTLPVLMVH